MAVHRGQWNRYQDLGPAVKRFEYMDRMDEEEADQYEAARQERERRALSQRVEPNRVLSVGGKRVAVYRGERARAMANLQRGLR